MKKICIILALLAIIVTSSAFVLSKSKYIAVSELPKNGQTFLTSYFKGSKVLTIEEHWSEYKILLNNGTKIKLDKNGIWEDLESKDQALLPFNVIDLLPRKAVTYIHSNFENWQVSEIEKKRYGYKIELINGHSDVDIEFDTNGNVRDVDF